MRLKVNIQLFAEAGAADSGTADGAEAAKGTVSGTSGDAAGDGEGNKGINDGGADSAGNDRATRYAEFKKEFKSELDGETQNAIKNRLKNLKNENDKLRRAIESQGMRYGIKDGNVDTIIDRMSNDDSVYAQRAEAEGLSIEQVKYIAGLEQQQRDSEYAARAQREQEIVDRWRADAQKISEKYGVQFDLDTEIQSPEFARLIKVGVPLETAYKVTHQEELNSRVAKAAHDKTEQAVTERIKARGMRPQENGASGQPAAIAFDPKNMTKEQREDIRRRVRRGEKIIL